MLSGAFTHPFLEPPITTLKDFAKSKISVKFQMDLFNRSFNYNPDLKQQLFKKASDTKESGTRRTLTFLKQSEFAIFASDFDL